MESKKKRKKKNLPLITGIISVLCMTVSLAFCLYPAISSVANNISNKNRNTDYLKTINTLSDFEKEQFLKDAQAYNDSLGEPLEYVSAFSYKTTSDYTDVLAFNDGQMASIKIPKINVDLPIYHGTGEDKLSKGAVHMPNTALPIGGTGNHSAISAHTAYPAKVFFDDLDKLEIGDYFFIQILDETHTYEVTDKNIVEPNDISLLQSDHSKDLITLITCYPYAVNSHRLFVRGERVADNSDAVSLESVTAKYDYPYKNTLYFIAAALLVITVIIIVILVIRRSKGKRKAQEEKQSR